MQIQRAILPIIFITLIGLSGCGGGSGSEADDNGPAASSSSSSTTSSSSSSGYPVGDYSFEFIFPPSGANAGGAAQAMHVRGRILDDQGEVVFSNNDTLGVEINGVMAEKHEDSESWVAEVPLVQGENSIVTSLIQAERETGTYTTVIDNTPVPNGEDMVASATGDIYSISTNRRAIVKTNSANAAINVVFDLSQSQPIPNCESLWGLWLPSGGDKLIAECQAEGLYYSSVLLIYDIGTALLQSIAFDSQVYASDILLIDDSFLFFQDWDYNYRVINLRTETAGTLAIRLPENSSYTSFSARNCFYHDGRIYFAASNRERDETWLSIAFPANISPETTATAAVLSTPTFSTEVLPDVRSLTVHGGAAFYVTGDNLTQVNLATLEVTTLPLSRQIASTESEQRSLNAMHFDNSTLLVSREEYDIANFRLIYQVDTESGQVSQLTPTKALPAPFAGTDLFISPDETTLLSFSYFANDQVLKIDTADYTVIEHLELADAFLGLAEGYGGISYDWSTNVLYRTELHNYWSVPSTSEVPFIVSYNFDTEQTNITLTNFDLAEYFGDFDASYLTRDVSVQSAEGLLWFSAGSIYDGGHFEDVLSLDLDSGSVQRLFTEEFGTESRPIQNVLLSEYSQSLNGLVVTSWVDGTVRLLNADGTIEELRGAWSPYVSTESEVVDESRGRFYYTGIKPLASSDPLGYAGEADPNSIELVSVDIATREERVIASANRGNGPIFLAKPYALNEDKQLLYGNQHEHLLVLDVTTGDRVLKALGR